MKILFLSNLFPDTAEPLRGNDNACLLAYLARTCELRVISPRPTLPLLDRVPRQPRAQDCGFDPVFPRAWYVPRVGSRWNHRLMAHCLRGPVKELRRTFPFDAVLVSWVYPDACAVARLAAEIHFPFVVIAQGSDVHQYLRNRVRRDIIVHDLTCAGAIITRSGELARLLQKAGVPADKLRVIYNGVDFDVFQPGDACMARKELGLPGDAAIVLYVGNFLPIKNPLRLVTAFAKLEQRLPDRQTRLIMVGDGPLLANARRQADDGGLRGRIMFVGRKTPPQVARYLQAADVLCVPSDNEGVPNAVLEAFAAGLPVVATRVGGMPEAVARDFLGQLVAPGDLEGLTIALASQLNRPRQTEAIRQYAGRFSWEQTVASYLSVLQRVR